jgi:hypothetical protein
MIKPTIAIINFNNSDNETHPGIDPKQWDDVNLSHYKLKDDIEEYIRLAKINTIYELFNIINVVVNPTDKHVVNIEDLYYTSDYVYQAIFKCVAKDINESYESYIKESNKLATQMLGERHMVDGNMILIKRSIINNDFDYTDVTLDDITDILRNQFLHKAIIIKPDDTIEEQSYIYSPLEINFGQSHIDNVRYHEFKFIDYRLFYHVDTKAEQTKINRIASIIYGKKIYGNVLISLSDNSDSSPLNLDMTKNLIKMIGTITIYTKSTNTEVDRKNYSRKLEIVNKDIEEYNPEIHKDFHHNNFPEITLCPNFFQIVQGEYNRIKNDINFDTFNEMSIIDSSVLNDII